MSYLVLARKYRSGNFDELVGQEHIARTLKRAIESDRVAHAYLFCGTRGTGKTSTARILAKCLNCEKSKKPTPDPCSVCETCKLIARGEDIDVIEIDAASNRGIDEVRRIIQNASFTPARSRFKVYIIDEVHAMTKDAFNALLKVLEEPPSHVKFILATTEPEKVLPTILSRCQRYDFRNIPTREIAGHLKNICKQEKIKADDDALHLIAKAGAGSMRDALSILDRLLSVGEKTLSVEAVEQMLGLPKAQLIFDLAQAIGEGDTKSTLKRANAIITGGLSQDSLVASLVDHLRNLLVLKTCGPDPDLVDVPGVATNDLESQAEKFDAVALTQDITILEELRRQMRQSQAGRALLDASLVRIALADQFASIAQLLGGSNGNPPAPTRTSAPAPAQKKNDPPAPVMREVQPSNVQPVGPNDLPAVWTKVLELISQRGPTLLALVEKGELVGIEDGQALVRYNKQHETFVRMLDRNGKKDILRDALTEARGESTGVKFDVDETAPDSNVEVSKPPARPPIPSRGGQSAAPPPIAPTPSIRLTPEMIASLRAEPLIKAIIEDLAGTVVKVEEVS